MKLRAKAILAAILLISGIAYAYGPTFPDSGGGGSSSFIGLTDVPASYIGQALKVLRVNAGETAVEFVTLSGTGITGITAGSGGTTTGGTVTVTGTGPITTSRSSDTVTIAGATASSSVPGFSTSNQTIAAIVCGSSAAVGTAAPTGYTGSTTIPYAATINSATITGTLSAGNCSAVIDVWKRAFSAGTRPAVGNTITASALPTLSAATGSQDTTLTGWTTSISAGDEVACNVNSNTCDHLTLTLKIAKT